MDCEILFIVGEGDLPQPSPLLFLRSFMSNIKNSIVERKKPASPRRAQVMSHPATNRQFRNTWLALYYIGDDACSPSRKVGQIR
ncbi:hypothetical protein Y032_0006g3141 [Ancylostoma ceylanicum]|uniref:Uncharacterized protein n=1 Tax=Ancylostoma ceylanicum TaxID=53326 RepID=A0A016VQM2_9BILA|nr:hypothetical protein Y032_0006g3141 [Ancylostoma ceylanicum]